MAAPKQNINLSLLTLFFVVLALGIIVYLNVNRNQVAPKVVTKNLTQTRDFMFQIDNYKTKNQGGQTVNMYFHYQYNSGIKTEDIPDYRDLRNDVIKYMDNLDIAQEPYWETLTKIICEQLKDKYPIQAISCQFQVMGDNRAGLPNEPGVHSSITTIGDIEPLSVVK
jgi:hypothetical protein